ncbi:MAG TPA: hypothetical protein VHZ55_25390 [Bryobacteraceae bacterium]|nr:hypothetical protein [Bryobacteraceae bacterium]
MHDWEDSGYSRVRTVIEAAARRRHLVLAVEHSAVALAALFAGVVLLLLLGTQILNWRWILLLSGIGFAVSFLRIRRCLVSRYAVAQLVDRRLHLSDALSTAWFLLEYPKREAVPLAASQIAQAEETALGVKPATVFPFVWRRAWALAGALAAVAFGLFAVRYLVTSSLDLRQALLPLHVPSFAEVLERFTGLRPNPLAKHSFENARIPASSQTAASKDATRPLNEKSNDAIGNSLPGDKERASSALPDSSKTGGKNGQPGTNPGKPQAGNKADPTNGNPPGNPSKNAEAKEAADRKPSPGLMDRMKDALSGLVAKMHPSQESAKNTAGERSEQDAKPGQQNPENNPQASKDQQKAPNSQQGQDQNREQNAQGQPAAQAAEKSPGSQSHASDQSIDHKGSDAHSGIGRQDGEKSLKEAEQLKAMGKLDEIIGKRSAALTGDMTVETRSNHQQLQTQYSGQVGRHSDLGGEIDRNEVPIALQQYVREYMEQVRKQANGQQ